VIEIDVSDVKRLEAVLQKVEPQLDKDLRAGFDKAGQVAAGEARQNASFSSRIPRSILARRRGLGIRLQAGSPEAPHAAVYELGGRHPLFGNRNFWYPVEAVHYLERAVESDAPFEVVVASVDSALRGISVG